MKPLGEWQRHFWLVQGMARATGLDLVKARKTGALSEQDWAETVERCRSCAWVGGCERWLADGGARTAVPPKPCRNRARLAMLRVEQELAP